MIRTIYWYTTFVFSLLINTFGLIKVKNLSKKVSEKQVDEYTFKVVKEWAKDRVKASGADIKVYGNELIPKDKNVLFISNHQSDFDIAIFLALIEKNTGFISKIEMSKMPIVSNWMKHIHCTFMDRSDPKQSMKAILEGINTLKSGHSLVIFPEGKRSRSSKMNDFKAGSFKLATKSKVPIVPVTIDGSYKILEANNFKIVPASVHVYIHEPIETENLSKEEMSNLPDKVYNIIKNSIKN